MKPYLEGQQLAIFVTWASRLALSIGILVLGRGSGLA